VTTTEFFGGQINVLLGKVDSIAILIMVAFTATIIVYPVIFGTDAEPNRAASVKLETNKNNTKYVF